MAEALQRMRDALAPWSGLAAGTLGWALTHQIGSDSIQDDCSVGHPLFVLGVAIAGAIILAAGAWLSYRLWHGSDAADDQPFAGSRRFIAGVSLMAAAIFLMAIVLQTLAAFIIPACLAW